MTSVNGRSDMQKICEDTRESAKHATLRQPLGLVGCNTSCMHETRQYAAGQQWIYDISNQKLVLYQMTCDNAILTSEHDICINHPYRKKLNEVHTAHNIQYQIDIIIGLPC